jgi:hypothetical protein
MEIKAEWWMDDGRPIIQANIGGVVVNLTRREGAALVSEVEGCLNGIVWDLARYRIVSGWGKKEHLAMKDGYDAKAPVLCGAKPRRWSEDTDGEWYSDRVLKAQPDRNYICARCFAKYEKLEAAST